VQFFIGKFFEEKQVLLRFFLPQFYALYEFTQKIYITDQRMATIVLKNIAPERS